MSADEYQITQAGGDGDYIKSERERQDKLYTETFGQHASFCAGNHFMGQTPCTVAPTPAPRTEDFTAAELFDGNWFNEKALLRICGECGTICADESVRLHVSWHNKLLP